jgi:hypothetical protein
MANKTILFQGTDGKIVPVEAADNGDGTFSLAVTGAGIGGAATIANGADTAEGHTTDPANTATDATAVTEIALLKEISHMAQNPAPTSSASSSVSPSDQPSTNAYADVTGSTLDTLNHMTISYTIVNDGAQSIDWEVLGANAADFSDAQVVLSPATILAAGVSGYSAAQAVWRYYKVQIIDTIGGSHGAALVRGITKG